MLMSSPGDTPANRSASPVNEPEKTTHDTYGLISETPLASYDPDTHCWKMFGVISLWGDSPSLETLPPSGMTRNGELFQQPAWVPIIDATGLSLLHPPTATMNQMAPSMNSGWWPTPTAVEWKGRGPNSRQQGLAEKVQLWPTPTAVTRPMEGNVRLYRAKIEAGEMTEAEAEAILGKSVWEAQGKIPAVFPTPTYGKLAGGTGGINQIEALYSDGTITAEERRAMRAGNGGKLNPTWVEWLMGFPLGWTDLEDSETQ
jgi:hypothetical protein